MDENKYPEGWMVVDHVIPGVTTEMIDWWWDNMGPSERYKLWHPTDHVSFVWEVDPAENGHVGAIQAIQEYINGGELRSIRIRWDDPKTVPFTPVYSHFIVGSGLAPDNSVRTRLVHEYEDVPDGVRYRTTFLWSFPRTDADVENLRIHNIGEVGRFPEFLPELYRKETGRA